MYVYIYLYGEATPIILTLNHSMFVQNAANLGQTEVYIHYSFDPDLFQMTIVSTIFHRNFMLVRNYLRCDCAVLYLTYVKNITIVNSTFSDNNCTSVVAKSSIFHLQGTVEFYRNTGYSGGALAFYHDAQLCIHSNSKN